MWKYQGLLSSQQLLCSKSHDFIAVIVLAHSSTLTLFLLGLLQPALGKRGYETGRAGTRSLTL